MKKLYTYLLLGLVALPIAGFTGGMITSEKANAATKSAKKGSSATFYGRLFVQYDNSDNSTSNNQSISALRDDEGMGRFGVKGKSMIGNGYAVNYKVEYAIDIGDGLATGDSTNCTAKSDCRTFNLKQGWVGFLTPMGQFKFGSVESPYKSFAKHDILHDTIAQARDTRMISQGSMSHSSYWRESLYYELKSGNFKGAFIYGVGENTNNSVTNKDVGFGLEYKNFIMPGFDIVYARNTDDSHTSGQDYNAKVTLTQNFKMASGSKIKVWYMHEDVGLDNKMFTGGNNDGEVDWYGITYKSGPMTLQYSYAETDAAQGPTYDRDGYNIGMQYKLSKTSRIYIGHSSSDAGSGDGVAKDIESTMIGLRHDF
jgi:hypothetical protein